MKIANLLVKSTEQDVDLSPEEWNEAWKVELEKRLEQMESGKVKGIPFDEVMKKLRKSVRES